MILSDAAIDRSVRRGNLVIKPYDVEMLQPASLDVRLDKLVRKFNYEPYRYIDPKSPQDELTELVEVEEMYLLQPGELVLGTTVEYVEIPTVMVGQLEGKSSLARLGLIIHVTAGFIDPGFKGQITLEIVNMAGLPIALYPGMPIGQLTFLDTISASKNPYGTGALGSKYQNQQGPQPSQYWRNFV